MFDQQLQENKYLAVEAYSMADITILCAVDFAAMLGISIGVEYSVTGLLMIG